jgi:hypothetical protein
MLGTNEELKQAALEIVAELEPCRPNQLVKRLRQEYGASHRAANETLFTMMRDGRLQRTFTGKLRVPR